jgi:uncharacterized membrane protein HdeD (DUF308 family)
MDSIVERAEKELNRVRWSLGLNGLLSIVFGIVVLIWPGRSLFALTVVFGAFLTASGVVGLVTAVRNRGTKSMGWLAVSSLLNTLAGIAVLAWSGNGVSELALLYVIGAYAVLFGIVTMGGAFWLPLQSVDKALIALTGILSIAFGVVMFAQPRTGAVVVLAIIAAYALVIGISELVVAIGGKRLFERSVKRAYLQPKAQAS